MDLRLTLRLDAQPLLSALGQALHLADVAPEFRDSLVDLGDSFEKLVAVQVDSAAALSAGELVVRLDPSEGFRGLLAASGARDV